jgi:hypothetical protein
MLDRMISGEILVDQTGPGSWQVLQAFTDPSKIILDASLLPRPHEKKGEPGVTSYGFKFEPSDYEFRTHLFRRSERAHVKKRNRHIIGSLLLNKHPDVVHITGPNGETVENQLDFVVDYLHKYSKTFGAEHNFPTDEQLRWYAYATMSNHVLWAVTAGEAA